MIASKNVSEWDSEEISSKYFTPWVDDLRQRKRDAGRYFFHPDPAVLIDAKTIDKNTRQWALNDLANSIKFYSPYTNIVSDIFFVDKAPDSEIRKTEKADVSDREIQRLTERVRFLEAALTSDRPFLQLYRLGGSCLLVAAISLMVWALTGIGMPFHPLFAACVIPASLGVMVMAFLIRPSERPK